MSEMKHTAGPWEVDPLKQGILGDVSTADGSQCVAQAQQVSGDDLKQSIRAANARLIAAAPDLLEALKDARYALYGNGPGNPKIDAAIAKAEGQP